MLQPSSAGCELEPLDHLIELEPNNGALRLVQAAAANDYGDTAKALALMEHAASTARFDYYDTEFLVALDRSQRRSGLVRKLADIESQIGTLAALPNKSQFHIAQVCRANDSIEFKLACANLGRAMHKMDSASLASQLGASLVARYDDSAAAQVKAWRTQLNIEETILMENIDELGPLYADVEVTDEQWSRYLETLHLHGITRAYAQLLDAIQE